MPPIVDFAEHPSFLGKNLYPKQKTLLKLIYLETESMTPYDVDTISKWADGFHSGTERVGVSPDIWERVRILKEQGYPHFREVLFIGGRRGGKGVIGAIAGARQNWKLLQLDDPQWYYGVEPGKDLYGFVTATNLIQAKQFQFADLANAIISAKCFEPYIVVAKEYFLALRTPADTRRIAEFQARGVTPQRLIASVRNVAMTSNSRSGRGAAGFMDVFDEMAHMLTGTPAQEQ